MAGHSKFKNIMHRKGAQDKKRARDFARLTREISAAVRLSGADPAQNPRLRTAIQTARAANMPKDNIQRAMQKSSEGTEDEIRYEGYGPGGVALIIETMTDNRNRTASAIRSILSKNGGNLAENNAVSFLFQRKGVLSYPKDAVKEEELFTAAVEFGAEDVEEEEDTFEVLCAPDIFHALRESLEKQFPAPESAEVGWHAGETIMISSLDKAQKLLRLLEVLEECDDVQQVFSNFSVESAILARLES